MVYCSSEFRARKNVDEGICCRWLGSIAMRCSAGTIINTTIWDRYGVLLPDTRIFVDGMIAIVLFDFSNLSNYMAEKW